MSRLQLTAFWNDPTGCSPSPGMKLCQSAHRDRGNEGSTMFPAIISKIKDFQSLQKKIKFVCLIKTIFFSVSVFPKLI